MIKLSIEALLVVISSECRHVCGKCLSQLSATIKLPTGSDYSLELDLLHPVLADKTIVKVLSTKVSFTNICETKIISRLSSHESLDFIAKCECVHYGCLD